jgi:hypothetical protein
MFRILNKLNDLFIIKNNVNLSIALSRHEEKVVKFLIHEYQCLGMYVLKSIKLMDQFSVITMQLIFCPCTFCICLEYFHVKYFYKLSSCYLVTFVLVFVFRYFGKLRDCPSMFQRM